MMIIALRASFVVAIFRNRKQKMQKSELFKFLTKINVSARKFIPYTDS